MGMSVDLNANPVRGKSAINPSENKQLRILNININNIKNKLEELCEIIYEINPDVITIQETKRTKLCKNIRLYGYIITEKLAEDEANKNGLLIGYKKEWKSAVTINILDDFMIKISIKAKDQQNLNIINTYVPNNTDNRENTLKNIVKELRRGDNTVCIGDFNMPKQDLVKKLTIENVPHDVSEIISGGSRWVSGCESDRLIDFTIANNKGLIREERYIKNLHISDHYAILATLNLNMCTASPTPEVVSFNRSKLIHDTKIRDKIRRYNFTTDDALTNQELFDRFYLELDYVIGKHHLLENIKPENKIIRHKIIRKLIEKRKENNNPTEIKKLNKLIRSKIRAVKKKKFENFIKHGCDVLKSGNHREGWKWLTKVANLNEKKRQEIPLADPITKCIIADPIIKARMIRDHLEALAKKEGEDPDDHQEYEETPVDHPKRLKLITDFITAVDKKPCLTAVAKMTDEPIKWNEIRETLKRSRNYKAASADNLPVEIYKVAVEDHKCKTPLGRVLLLLMNKCLENGFTPTQWMDNIVVLIFKKGNPEDLENYRGITLINTLCKVYAKILADRLSNINAEFNIIRKEQTGFIKGEVGLNTVSSVVEICERRKQRNLETWLLFIDFKKAYDMVSQEKLIEKLKMKQLGPKFIESISSLYRGTKMRVRVDNALSEPFEYKRGVRQGCPTSPLLFDIFIDDLLSEIKGILVPNYKDLVPGLCFADDTLILAESIQEMQSKCKILDKWICKNKMEININKCGLMSIAHGPKVGNVTLNNIAVERVDKYKYLGVELNDSLDFKAMGDHRTQVGYQTVETIKNFLLNKTIPLIFKKMLINSVLIPRMTYGIDVFGFKANNLKAMKKVISTGIRMMFNNFNICLSAAHEELNIMPIEAFARYMQIKNTINTRKVSIYNGLLLNCETGTTPNGVKNTRMSEIRQFIKRNNLETIDRKRLKEDIWNLFRSKKQIYPPTYANHFRETHGIYNGKKLMKIELSNEERSAASFISLCRVNGVLNSHTLIRRNMIDEKYYEKCLLCKEIFKDHITHWATECNGTRNIRDSTLGEIKSYFQKRHKENWKIPLVNYILEGKNTNKTEKKIVNEYRAKSRTFMKDLATLRKQEIKRLMVEKKLKTQDDKDGANPSNTKM